MPLSSNGPPPPGTNPKQAPGDLSPILPLTLVASPLSCGRLNHCTLFNYLNITNTMELRRSRRPRASLEESPDIEANMGSRPRRLTRSSAAAPPASVTVSRSSEDPPGEATRTLRLTVKMPAGKLREATGGRAARRTVNVFQENPIVTGPRTSRNKRKIVEVPTSDDDDDDDLEDQEEDEVDDEDAPGEEDDEDADADADIDMDDVPPQPPVRRATKAAATRGKAAKSVEAKEMELEEEEEEEDEVDEDDDDEALSDTDTDAEGELDDQEESAIPDVNVDDLDEEDEEDELDEDMDSDAMALNSGKTTKRQRGNLGNDFLQLPMGKLIFENAFIPQGDIALTKTQNLK